MTTDVTILLVDDEEDVAKTYRDLLEIEYSVRVAISGEAALSELDPTVDIVLLDRRMPGMSGDEVLEEIRARDHDCRVVMITAADPDIEVIGMDFDEYLTKPITGKQLREVVEQMLARIELDQKIQQMFAIASKLSTLESKLSFEQLDDSDEYTELRSEFHALRNEVTVPESTDDPYLESTLEKMEALVKER